MNASISWVALKMGRGAERRTTDLSSSILYGRTGERYSQPRESLIKLLAEHIAEDEQWVNIGSQPGSTADDLIGEINVATFIRDLSLLTEASFQICARQLANSQTGITYVGYHIRMVKNTQGQTLKELIVSFALKDVAAIRNDQERYLKIRENNYNWSEALEQAAQEFNLNLQLLEKAD